MSAIRHNPNRAEARKKNALPYGRSSVKKFFLRVLGFADEEQEEEPEVPELPIIAQPNDRTVSGGEIFNSTPRTQDNAFRGTPHQPSFGNRQPLSQVDFSNISPMGARDPPPSFSVVPDARSVANYLSNKSGTTVDANFVESMVTELQATPEKNEKFRFSFTTPGQETSSLFSPNSTPTSSTASPSKKLTRNPNGIYRWDGAGSAKHARPRNRYASPAFGASVSKPDRLVMRESNGVGETDHKRRKTGESAASESSGSSLPFPITASPSTPKANGTSARPTAASPSTRLRTPAKPTAPVVPSPLRQAWSDASSTSSREDSRNSPTQQIKATKTATFMADLIKETTPPKKPDLSNPYQTASPVGKVGPPRRGTKRQRATGRPALPSREDQIVEEKKQKEKEKLDSYSPQAIIEATVPKGSKRSRPPANFEKSALPDVNESINRDASDNLERKTAQYQVEEPEDDGSSRATKKPKPTLNGNGRPSGMSSLPTPTTTPDITIEEISDVPMREENKDEDRVKTNGKDTTKATNGNVSAAAAASANTPTSRSSFSALKSIPKEPSKLRFSFQAEGSLASSSTPVTPPLPLPKPSPPAVDQLEQPKFALPSSGFNFSFKTDSESTKENKTLKSEESTQTDRPPTVEEIKASVKAMDSDLLPVFAFTFTGIYLPSNSADHVRARSDVKVLPPSSLPAFNFSDPVIHSPSGFKFGLTPAQSTATSSDTPKPSPPRFDLPPVKAFDFAAAGMKMEVKKDVWTCFCGVVNNNSAVQCMACESPAPSTTAASKPVEAPQPTLPAAPAVKAFDFAAAGFKMPTVNKDTWTCSECTLSNPNSATTCGPCGADRT